MGRGAPLLSRVVYQGLGLVESMIVSHKHKFIFLKTNKTAGTSIEIGLSKYCGPDDIITKISPADEKIRTDLGFTSPQNYMSEARFWRASKKLYYNHLKARRARKLLGRKVWDEYFKFTVERNPFDKAISRYWWDTRKEHVRPSFTAFLNVCPPHKLSNWSVYAMGDEVAVDYVIRFENIKEGLTEVSEKVGIGPIDLALAKSSFRSDKRPYREVLTINDRRLIERICHREIGAFGYEW